MVEVQRHAEPPELPEIEPPSEEENSGVIPESSGNFEQIPENSGQILENSGIGQPPPYEEQEESLEIVDENHNNEAEQKIVLPPLEVRLDRVWVDWYLQKLTRFFAQINNFSIVKNLIFCLCKQKSV